MGSNNLKLITLALVAILSINFVLALGVSSPYWDKNPLKMFPGETKEVAFTLTNSPNSETATAIVTLDEGAGIAEVISGEEYTVAPGTTSTKVILKISVPETATLGTIYNIKFSVKSAPSDEEGTVQIIMGYNIEFPVKVIEQSQEEIPEVPEETENNWLVWAIIIIVILIILYFVFRKKR